MKSLKTKEDSDIGRLMAIKDSFIPASKQCFSSKRVECVEPESWGKHTSSSTFKLRNSPGIFLFRLSFYLETSNMSIFKLLLSLPEMYLSKKLFSTTEDTDNAEYTIKGLVTSSGAHNLVFFRRDGCNDPTQDWMSCNSEEHESFGSWADIVKTQYENLSYPTAVIYEKVTTQTPKSSMTLLNRAKIAELHEQLMSDYGDD